jgi:uncharacterized protein (TIRG00374 family)
MADSSKTRFKALKIWLRGLLGIAVGLVFLKLALAQTDLQEIGTAFSNYQFAWIVIALGFYAVSLTIRVIRWRSLMLDIRSLPYPAVSIALVVGYAVNNLLPARLGELFRANFAAQRNQLAFSAVLGSIAVERTVDGLVVVLSLICGSLFLQSNPLLNSLIFGSSILFGGLFLTLLWLNQHAPSSLLSRLPTNVHTQIRRFQNGLSGLQVRGLLPLLLISLAVWTFEALAHWSILRALGVLLNWQQMLSVVGVINLSTLIPSAPGFAGTYQYAYVFVLGLFGFPAAMGIAAATTAQIFLLGSTTLLGILLYLLVNVGAIATAKNQRLKFKTIEKIIRSR